MSSLLKSALVALQFLTQVPVFFKQYPDDKSVAGSLIFYPLIGLLIGAGLSALALMMGNIPAMLSAAILLTLWVAISGGLHLDGLADSCDAWIGGHGDKQRTLEIMKDPCSGPIAVVMLVCTLLLKFSALIAILDQQAYALLLVAPFITRAILPLLLLLTPYVRKNGIGAVLVKHAPRTAVFVVCGISLFIAAVCSAFSVVLVAIASAVILRKLMMNRLDGLTGDTAGASVEIIETVVLIAIVFNL